MALRDAIRVATPTLTVSTTVVRLPPPSHGAGHSWLAEVNAVMIEVQAAAIRYDVTGREPSATVGKVLEVGDIIYLTSRKMIEDFRTIRRDASDATLDLTFAKEYIP